MVIAGRRRKAIAQGWNAVNKQRREEAEKLKAQTENKEEISKEEHEARIRALKDLGLVK